VQPLITVGFIAIAAIAVVLAVLLGDISGRKRREAMATLAAKLGLRFDPGKDWDIAQRYSFLDKLRVESKFLSGERTTNRYAFNILSGSYQRHDVTIFDYHYITGSGKSAQDHYISFFILHLPASFPELVIGPEDIFSKIGQALGYDDIDFESYEFSRKFCVRSPDKKFAYDVCNARMIEYLLSNTDLTIEIEGEALAVSFSSRLSPEQIEPNLNRLITIRSLLPEYLFSRR
jgi:hypothetical protein